VRSTWDEASCGRQDYIETMTNAEGQVSAMWKSGERSTLIGIVSDGQSRESEGPALCGVLQPFAAETVYHCAVCLLIDVPRSGLELAAVKVYTLVVSRSRDSARSHRRPLHSDIFSRA
jgi:hypothetical protein